MWTDVSGLSPPTPAPQQAAEGLRVESHCGAHPTLILMVLMQEGKSRPPEILSLDLWPWGLISFFLGHRGLSAKTPSLTNDPCGSQRTSPCPLRAPPPPVPCSPEHPVQSLWGGGSKAVGQALGVALCHWVWFCSLGQLPWASVFPSAVG